jgi:eukaryotic-like serine/threonine-protein kinase
MLIDGRFRVIEVAREGGMGVVSRGIDTQTGESVAIKRMRTSGHVDEARFFREANVLSSLSYPSIVGFRGYGKLPTGESWLAMEWLDGESLAARLEHGPLSIYDAMLVAKAIAGALVVAHERGIVHRDIKPSNVILVNKDPACAKLIDFGLARIRDADRATWSGSILGTPAYMAPEQIRAASHVDGRADLYALGALLFECLAGRAPFAADGDALGAITRALFEVAPKLRDIDSAIPEPLNELVTSLLEKEPQRRLAPARAAFLSPSTKQGSL